MGTEDMISLSVSSDFEDRDENGEPFESDPGLINPNSEPGNSVSEEGTVNGVNVGLNKNDTGAVKCTTDEQDFRLSKGGTEIEEGSRDQEELGPRVGEIVTEGGTTTANNLRSNAGDSGPEEGEIEQSNFAFREGDVGTEACQTEVDMDLVDSPVMQVNIKVASTVQVAENLNNFSARVSAENHSEFQNQSLIHNLSMDGNRVSGVKRARMTYDEDQPLVHVTYNSLTRASKQKLEEFLQQWSAWHAQNDSFSQDGNEVLESGEETYFPALRVGVKNTSAVSFWIENQTRKPEGDGFISLDNTSVPLYDRGYALGLTSADGPANGNGVLVVDDAARCFNCGSYNHSLKECPKPRDNIAVNHARQQHKSRRNQSASSRNPVRYYQKSSGGKYDGLKPGALDAETQLLLGLGELDPPPWLYRMRELGYPPGYLDPDNDDQPSGITIFGDGDAKEEHEEGEIAETRIPDPQRKKSVEFPGINAPIPEKADERLWLLGPSSVDSLGNQSHHRYSYSSEPKSRWRHHEQRSSRDLVDDGPPGVESWLSPSMSSYPPRGRRSTFACDDSTSHSWHGSPPHLYSNRRSSPHHNGLARFEDENDIGDSYSTDYSSPRSYEYEHYRHRRRK
uniref:Nucleic acid binding protein n=3 Tax=Rhizophora mucronata TaxID=61149 RepID=A0A2P2L9H4_RHIMU